MKLLYPLTILVALAFVIGSGAQAQNAQPSQSRTEKCMARCKAECKHRNPGGDSGRMSGCMDVCQRQYNC